MVGPGEGSDKDLMVDAPLLTVPLESLKRVSRERKSLIEGAKDVGKQLEAHARFATSKQDRLNLVSQLIQDVQALRSKARDIAVGEEGDLRRSEARLNHLLEIRPAGKDRAVEWTGKRLERLIADHLLREGHMASARMLTQGPQRELVEVHIFEEAYAVVEGLCKRQCTAGLQWCSLHQARLRKAKSTLEFKLRVQEFVELVREERIGEAMLYARKHLAPWAGAHLEELMRAFTCVVFGGETDIERYAQLFDLERWKDLQNMFFRELFRMHGMPERSLLATHLRAGLMALKVPHDPEDAVNLEDPLHLPHFQQLAAELPNAKYQHSKLLCAISGDVMDEDNPPLVMPDGAVYSCRAVHAAMAQADGKFLCPETGQVYTLAEMKRAFFS